MNSIKYDREEYHWTYLGVGTQWPIYQSRNPHCSYLVETLKVELLDLNINRMFDGLVQMQKIQKKLKFDSGSEAIGYEVDDKMRYVKFIVWRSPCLYNFISLTSNCCINNETTKINKE